MVGKVTIVVGLAFLFQAMLIAGAVILGVESIPFAFAPAVVAYCVYFAGPIEGIVILFLIGCLLDAAYGSLFGVTVISEVLIWLVGIAISSWFGRPKWLTVFVQIAFFSFVYRILLFLISTGFFAIRGNFNLGVLLWAPLVDGLLGLLFLKVLSVCLNVVKLPSFTLELSGKIRI